MSDGSSSSPEEAIRYLTAFYSDAINHHEPLRAASVYAQDGRLAPLDAPELVGRDAIAQAIQQSLAPLALLLLFAVSHAPGQEKRDSPAARR